MKSEKGTHSITFRPTPENWDRIGMLKERGLRVNAILNQALTAFLPKLEEATEGIEKAVRR